MFTPAMLVLAGLSFASSPWADRTEPLAVPAVQPTDAVVSGAAEAELNGTNAAVRQPGPQFSFSVVASGLNQPIGIAVHGGGTVYFTEVPTPGIPGSMGGMNAVKVIELESGAISTLSSGEPEPLNLALSQEGVPAWTCRTAGVILTLDDMGDRVPLLTGLLNPTGIAMNRDAVYFTQIPTPGVPGTQGGSNTTNSYDGTTIATLTTGEPEPYDIAVSSDGTAYWTCRSAGVILTRSPEGAVQLVLGGLSAPTGIALDEVGGALYFTEVPTPGVPGSAGGMNTVNRIDLSTGTREVLNSGDPEPTDIAVASNGRIYWTCTSAGVIVEGRRTRGR
jgi:glucose/arabinose dehydrogenase